MVRHSTERSCATTRVVRCARTSLWCAAFSGAALCCGDRGPAPEKPTEIVGGIPPRWTVDPTARIDLGDRQRAVQAGFSSAIGAARLPTGLIAAGDYAANVVRLFDAAGRYVRNAGEGDGEVGQLHFLSKLQPCTDGGFATDDRSLGRVVLFDALGKYRGMVVPKGLNASSVLLACLKGDRLAFAVYGNSLVTPGVHRLPVQFERVEPSGATAIMTTVGSWEAFVDRDIGGYIERPFANRSLSAATDSGLFIADADDSVVSRESFAGSRLRFRHPLRSRSVNAADRATAAWQFALRHDPRARFDDIIVRSVPYRNRVPAVRDLVIDKLGDIWLRAWEPSADGLGYWIVLDSAGRPLSSVVLPPMFEVTEVGKDYVLGFAMRDYLPHLQILTLHRDARS